jgi:hypothetical protein
MTYLLDANVFIQARRFHYGFDICPGFWDWIDQQHRAAGVVSVAQVGRELAAGNDQLAEWADERGELFREPDPGTVKSMAVVSQWVVQQGYEPAAINTFLQVADYYLVAMAHAHGHVLVTHERPDGARRRVKIPNVCIGLGVRFMNPFEMLRAEQVRFVLALRA